MLMAASLLLLTTAIVPGQLSRTPFLCHTAEAAMRFGIAVDTQPDRQAAVIVALVRGSECILLPPALAPAVAFEEQVGHEASTDVWRVKWGAEDWYVPIDTAGRGA